MSVHPSLGSKGKGKRKRSVMKRYERLKEMLEKEKWQPGDSVYGLMKLKVLRWKAKKAKKAVEEEAAGEGATEATAAQKTTAKTTKEASGAKKDSQGKK
ncbi:MAG: small basic protein [Candidatus Omnitrophica bacterium]|nr:small basic protein [Candidatus Omnitrophota bacterium]